MPETRNPKLWRVWNIGNSGLGFVSDFGFRICQPLRDRSAGAFMNPWFANSWVLWFGALLPTLGMIVWWSRRWRRRRLGELGALYGLVHVRRGPRVIRGLCVFAGLLLLIAGAAGPQWDIDTSPEAVAAPTRDLVIVLDLSRSMLAELPSRQELAQRGVKDLQETLKKRGGVRVA